MARRCLVLTLIASFLVGPVSLLMPFSASAQESFQSFESETGPTEGIRPQSEDPRLDGIIAGLIRAIRRIPHNIGEAVRTIMRLLRRLAIILNEYFGAIDDQIQSSQCHNRDCSEYGTR